MPAYAPVPATEPGMYDDGPDSGGAAPADEQEDEGGETAVIPKSLCPGMKAGQQIILKIVSVQGDSYQVAYKPKEESSEESEPAETGGDTGGESMYG